jgi:N-acetylglutamate synthase
MTGLWVRELEGVVTDTWPAEDRVRLGVWWLRYSGGPTRSGNSVATLNCSAVTNLTTSVTRAEAWYRSRQAAPSFQVGPGAQRSDLDQLLVARGYEMCGMGAVAVATPKDVIARTEPILATSIEREPGARWWGLASSWGRFKDRPEVLRGFLSRLATRCRFAIAYAPDGQSAGCCLAIKSHGRLGVYGMLTRPDMRRRGAARSLLNVLASTFRSSVKELYLLVDLANVEARRLYSHSGFSDAYTYHYRVHDAAGGQRVKG